MRVIDTRTHGFESAQAAQAAGHERIADRDEPSVPKIEPLSTVKDCEGGNAKLVATVYDSVTRGPVVSIIGRDLQHSPVICWLTPADARGFAAAIVQAADEVEGR